MLAPQLIIKKDISNLLHTLSSAKKIPFENNTDIFKRMKSLEKSLLPELTNYEKLEKRYSLLEALRLNPQVTFADIQLKNWELTQEDLKLDPKDAAQQVYNSFWSILLKASKNIKEYRIFLQKSKITKETSDIIQQLLILTENTERYLQILKQRLKELERCLTTNNQERFYALLEKLIDEYLAHHEQAFSTYLQITEQIIELPEHKFDIQKKIQIMETIFSLTLTTSRYLTHQGIIYSLIYRNKNRYQEFGINKSKQLSALFDGFKGEVMRDLLHIRKTSQTKSELKNSCQILTNTINTLLTQIVRYRFVIATGNYQKISELEHYGYYENFLKSLVSTIQVEQAI